MSQWNETCSQSPANKIEPQDVDPRDAEIAALRAELEAAQRDATRLVGVIRRVIGDHNPPGDCYSTGPITGTMADHVCVACEALNIYASMESHQD